MSKIHSNLNDLVVVLYNIYKFGNTRTYYNNNKNFT